MDKLQDSIGEWGKSTFGHSMGDLIPIYYHIKKEVKELGDNIEDWNGTLPPERTDDFIQEECADIFILVCSIAHLLGFSLREAVGCKMAINRSREWGEPDADGVIEHIRNEPTDNPTNTEDGR